jgi:hypothetical protein
MLEKMGWRQGQGLGVLSSGIVEPVLPAANPASGAGRTAGLGSGTTQTASNEQREGGKPTSSSFVWSKTRARYDAL